MENMELAAKNNRNRNIQKLRQEMGIEGYGIYYAIIEYLFEAENNKLRLSTLSELSLKVMTSKEKLERVIYEFSLFNIDDNYFWHDDVSRLAS